MFRAPRKVFREVGASCAPEQNEDKTRECNAHVTRELFLNFPELASQNGIYRITYSLFVTRPSCIAERVPLYSGALLDLWNATADSQRPPCEFNSL